MKAIMFDVDGVIVLSDNRKIEINKIVLEKYGLYDIKGVKEILDLGLNRKLIVDKIHELKTFDKEKILKEMDELNLSIENSPEGNKNIIDFIKNNYENYIFTTNTALPKESLDRIVNSLGIKNRFKDLLSFDSGTKSENVIYVLEKYNLEKKDILFIDDNINHINSVKETGVNVLHFNDYDIDINKYI